MNTRSRVAIGFALVAGLAWFALPTALTSSGISTTSTSEQVVPVERSAARPGSVAAHAAYASDERLVRIDAEDLASLAADYGLTVLREPGRSGYALVRGDYVALSQLADDVRVTAMARHGRTGGS